MPSLYNAPAPPEQPVPEKRGEIADIQFKPHAEHAPTCWKLLVSDSSRSFCMLSITSKEYLWCNIWKCRPILIPFTHALSKRNRRLVRTWVTMPSWCHPAPGHHAKPSAYIYIYLPERRSQTEMWDDDTAHASMYIYIYVLFLMYTALLVWRHSATPGCCEGHFSHLVSCHPGHALDRNKNVYIRLYIYTIDMDHLPFYCVTLCKDWTILMKTITTWHCNMFTKVPGSTAPGRRNDR